MAENSNRLNDQSFPPAPADQGAVARGNSKTVMAGDGESASRLSWRDPEQPTVANSPGRGANPGGRARLKAWRRRLVQELKAKGQSQRGIRRRGWWSLPNSCDWGRAGIIDSIIPPSYQHLSLLQYRLRHTEFTAESALLELGTMYKVYLRDAKLRFKLSRVLALTKKQEVILKAIDRRLLQAKD